MAKFNLTTQENTVAPEGRVGLLKDISDQLDLVDSNSSVPSEIQPETTMEPQELPAPTPEEALELEERDKANQTATSLQDTYGTSPAGLVDNDIHNVFGPVRAPDIISNLNIISEMDTVMLPFYDEGKGEALSMLGVPREPKVLEVGAVDTDNYVDKGKTIPLTQPEMFHKLEAYEVVQDGRGLAVTKDFQILALEAAEVAFARDAAAQKHTPTDLVDSMGKREAAELTGVAEDELPSGVNTGTLGAAIYDGWTKFKQRSAEGPESRLDKHLDDSQRMTKEAEELLGSYAKVMYGIVNPGVVSRQPVVLQNGMESVDYVLTPNGIKSLTDRNQHLMEPQLYVRPQVTADPQKTTKYSKSNESTGKHVEDKKGHSLEEESRSYFASIMSVIPESRKKLGFIFLGSAINYSAQASQDPETGDITVSGIMGDAYNMGQKVADKINKMAANTILEAQGLEQQLTTIMQTGRGGDRIPDLQKRIQAMRSFAAESSQPEWKMNEYRRKATQALGVMQNVAEFSSDAFSFTNYVQKGTSRTGLSAQKMNPQNHKIVRQLIGEGTIYTIQPNSNSTYERAMLQTLGSHFFPEPNLKPDKIIRDMRDRIQMKDDKVLRIAEVGRKLKVALRDYKVQPAIASAMNLNMDKETGQVTGVNDFTGKVLDPLQALSSDQQVKDFLRVAFKDHPDEAINLAEEAIELSNYMDSVESGKPFQSTMRPIEVDGISNGIAALSMQIGSFNMAHRTGVMSKNPDRILADFVDEDGNWQDEANTRAALSVNMRNSLLDVYNDKDFSSNFGSSTPDIETIRSLLDLAIKNEKEFLKPPVMTLPYGQAVASMGPQMLRAVTTNPELQAMSAGLEIGELGVAKLLHKILSHNLEITLGSEVSEFSQAMKSVTVAAMAADEPIVYRKATGTITSVNSVDYAPTGGSVVEAKIGTRSVGKDGSPKRNEGSNRLKVHPMELKLGALGTKAGGGSAIKLGILPQGIIGLDGSTMTMTFTGNNLKRIQSVTKQNKPYVIPIYDAVLTSLGSFEAVSAEINRTWVKTTTEYDLLTELHDGAAKAHAKGQKKLEALALKNPNGLADPRHAGHLFNAVKMSKFLSNGGRQRFWDIMADADKRLQTVVADYGKNESFTLNSALDMVTNKQLLELFMLDKPNSLSVLSDAQQVAFKLKGKRKSLVKEIGPDPVSQYYPDVLKNFNF